MLDSSRFVTTTKAALILGLSGERVRQLADTGTLPAERTIGGVRLYLLADVQALAAQRAAGQRDPQ